MEREQTLPAYGVIFDAGWHGQKTVSAPKQNRFMAKVFRGLGVLFLLISVASIILFALPIVASEYLSRSEQAKITVKEEVSYFGMLSEMIKAQGNKLAYAKNLAFGLGVTNTEFSIYIPKISAKAPIIENVDASNIESMREALKQGVAQAAGSKLPTEGGGMFLFAHSANDPWQAVQYNAVFYKLNDLQAQDEDLIYIFYQGYAYIYKVSQKYIVDSSDTSWLSSAKTGKERLIIQTCWPPGTTWKRVIVVAQRVLDI